MAAREFFVDIEASVVLGLDDIWPDGDAPENPTAEDVAALMRKCGSKHRVLDEWDLVGELTITVSAWDGPPNAGVEVWP